MFDLKFGDVIIDRQAANDELFRMFFDRPEFREVLRRRHVHCPRRRLVRSPDLSLPWQPTRPHRLGPAQVYNAIQDGLGGAA